MYNLNKSRGNTSSLLHGALDGVVQLETEGSTFKMAQSYDQHVGLVVNQEFSQDYGPGALVFLYMVFFTVTSASSQNGKKS
jgi:hypothetical protein